MIRDFDNAFDLLIDAQHEGTYSDNPADPGGETMYGITEAVARANGYTGPMKDLPKATAKVIAKKKYWDVVRGDEVPTELAFQLLDACYNSGPQQAIKWLQRSLNLAESDVDGNFGPQTMTALNQVQDYDRVVMRFDANRLLFLCDLKIWPSFGKGWARRVATNLLIAAK